MLVYAADEKYM